MGDMKKYVPVILLVVLISILVGWTTQAPAKQPLAGEGLLDLSYWNIEQGILKLDGQWEFYWNQLGTDNFDGYINVPGAWNGYVSDGKKVTGNGYATYRLFIRTGTARRMALYLPRIFTSYNIFFNGKPVASAGKVAQTREKSTPQFLPQIAIIDLQQGDNEFIIHVSNFYHRTGGLYESLLLGDEKSIINYRYGKLSRDLIIFGALFIIGLYHLALALYRRKDKSSLYFGLFSLFISIRTLIVGERFFNILFPDFSWEITYKIQTLTFYLGVPTLIMYFKSVFRKNISLFLVRVVQAVSAALSLVVLLFPVRYYSTLNPYFQIFCFIVATRMLFIFIKLISKRDSDSVIIVLGGFVLIITSLNDIVFFSAWYDDLPWGFVKQIIRTGNLSSIGQLIFIFTNSLVAARKLAMAIDYEAVISAKLKYINLNLDKLVRERTKELEETKQKIEEQKEELQRTNLMLQKLSLRDPLTNLWNRRYYNHILNIEWQNCMNDGKPISLIILDIDFFKEYNDFYGHIAGDECLEKVAQTIKHYFKKYPIVRYGGEEFVIILPDIGEEDAYNAAEFTRKIIENLKIPHLRSSVNSYVTVSIGCATLIPEEGISHETLFRKADKGLYEAKTTGRNRVVSFKKTEKEGEDGY